MGGEKAKKEKNTEVRYFLTSEALSSFAEFIRKQTIKAYREEEAKSRRREKRKNDPVLNAKKMLQNYRAYVRNLEDSEEIEITEEMQAQYRFDFLSDLMGTAKDEITHTEERIRGRIRSLSEQSYCVREIERAVRLYMEETDNSESEEAKRRFRVILSMYIEEKEKKVEDIAEIENVSRNTIYNDIEVACESIAIYMAGR